MAIRLINALKKNKITSQILHILFIYNSIWNFDIILCLARCCFLLIA